MELWLESLNMWHWFILCLLLLFGVAAGAGEFLMGTAVSALLLGCILAVYPVFSWQVQLFAFATFSVVFSFLYWRRFTGDRAQTESSFVIHEEQLMGKTLVLQHSLPLGYGKIELDDQLWSVHCDEKVEPGVTVRIVGIDGAALKIIPIRPANS